MPQSFNVISLNDITADFLGKQLSEISQTANLLTGSVEPEPFSAGDLQITLGLQGKAELKVINAGEVDSYGVLGEPVAQDDDKSTTIKPQITFQPGQAWTRYVFLAQSRLGAAGKPGDITLGVNAKSSFSLGSYRIHSADERLEQAVAADLGHFLLILSREDVLALQSGEALTMIASGDLQATASFSWANVLTTGISSLTRLLHASELMVVEIDESLRVNAGIQISDDFKVVFSRNQDQIMLAISKAAERGGQFALSATVTAGLQNPGDFEQAVNALINGLYKDLNIPQIEKILNQINQSELTQIETDLITKLFDKLKLSGPVSDIAEFRERWLGLQQQVGTFLSEISQRVDSAAGEAQASIDRVLDQIRQTLFENAAIETIEKINRTLQFDNLNQGEQQLVTKVLQALSLEGPLQDARDLVARILAIEDRVSQAINSGAATLTDNIADIQQEIDGAIAKVRNLLLGNEYVVKVNNLLALASKDSLIQMGTDQLNKLLQQVGLDKLFDLVGQVRAKWQAFNQKVQAAIARVAQTHAEIAYSFEYQHSSESTQLLEMSFSPAAFQSGPYHAEALVLKVADLVAAGRTPPAGVTLLNYLAQETKRTSFQYGFALNLGKWSIFGRDQAERELQTRTNTTGKQMVNFTGLRTYDGREFFQNKFSWSVWLNAQSPNWSTTPTATLTELSYTLRLSFEWQVGKLDEEQIARLIDQATLWGALMAQESPATDNVVARLKALSFKGKISFASQLYLDDKGFRAALSGLAKPNTAAYGNALGAAMPWNSVISSVQPFLAQRRALYGPLWAAYLNENLAAGNDARQLANLAKGITWGRIAAQTIIDKELPHSLAALEQNRNLNHRLWLMSGMVGTNPGTFSQWQAMVTAMNQLAQGLAGGAAAKQIEPVFKQSEPLFAQSHQVRALGAYLLTLAPPETVSRVLDVSYTDPSGQAQVMVLCEPAPSLPDAASA